MAERLQLRAWLLVLLDNNQTLGLEWIDKDQQIFAISWRHGRKKGWKSETDCQLFKKWAIYKKRYEPGNDLKNARLWKSRFRCALNALSDVRELKTLSKTKGDDARKIYQFMQRPPVMTVKRRRFPRADNSKMESTNLSVHEQEPCYNKIDTSQAIAYQQESQDGFNQATFQKMQKDCAEYATISGWQYIFYQTSQELYKISNSFCALDEDDIEANKTIEEFLSPKCV